MFAFDVEKARWRCAPQRYELSPERVAITTEPGTDLWQRTYYGFRNDNAPALLLTTDEPYFSFTVSTVFDGRGRYDQCGVIIYQDSDNWFKASVEYEDETCQRLGSVVTNAGYSDWATTDIDGDQRQMTYRLSRRESDYCVEVAADGVHFSQMRIFHLAAGGGAVHFGLYACSPSEGASFTAVFTGLRVTECLWPAHSA